MKVIEIPNIPSHPATVIGGWRKSSFSSESDCVEVALSEAGIAIRDSKDPDGPVLHITRGEMRSLVQRIRSGEFDSLI